MDTEKLFAEINKKFSPPTRIWDVRMITGLSEEELKSKTEEEWKVILKQVEDHYRLKQTHPVRAMAREESYTSLLFSVERVSPEKEEKEAE